MKKIIFLLTFLGITNIYANDVTIYYLPQCPHCHHALDFFDKELLKEMPLLKIKKINLEENKSNISEFKEALKKCNYTSGGVPLMLIKNICFQGYSKSMNENIKNILLEKKDNTVKKKLKYNHYIILSMFLLLIINYIKRRYYKK